MWGFPLAQKQDLVDHYRKIHERRVYGTSSVKSIRFLRPWIRSLRPKSIFDFGCGQSIFLDVLDLEWRPELYRYDPAIPAYEQLPETRADLLINIDVLEHIDEADLGGVLGQMRAHCHNAIIVVDTHPSKHRLPDGRNAHVTLHDARWWRQRLGEEFEYVEPIRTSRRSRAGFKTWKSTPRERLAYALRRLEEDVLHYARRLVGRHKTHWKISSTGHRDS